jgi:ubiquinone/menaquinone biosynthesis C-methylase UbiE
MSKIRVDDGFYLLEDRRDTVKESFKSSTSIISTLSFSSDNISLLDIGCATGDFLWHASKVLPSVSHFYGADVRDDLLQAASKRMPSIAFSQLDISCGISTANYLKYQPSVDLTFMCGVHPIFDTLSWVGNLSRLTKPQGYSLVVGPFGDAEYDVLVSVRKVGEKQLRSGWNTISIHSLKNHLNSLGRSYTIQATNFVLPFDLPPSSDPKRAYTINTLEYGRIQVNGLNLIRPQKLVLISWDR